MNNPANEAIQKSIDENEVMLFMKGNPTFPQCGFSSTLVNILEHMQVKFGSANVLEDEALREGIKAFSSWPTVFRW